MLRRIFTTLPGDSPWHAAAHNGVRSLVFIAKEWSDPESFQVCAFVWHCCRHIWILEVVGVALCLLCVSQAVEACILAQCPQLGSFQHRMLLPLQFPRCQRKDVNIREEDSFKFTVDVMQDEKVIAVMPISRSFWFAGEDHVQTSFSFGDVLLSQLSVPYICQYSRSTGLFAVAMLFSHTSCDQSVEACRPVKVPPPSTPSTKSTTSEPFTASTMSAPSSAVRKGAPTPQPKKAKPPAKLARKPKPKKAPPQGARKGRQRSPSVSSRTSSEESSRLNLRRHHSVESSETSQDRSPPRKLRPGDKRRNSRHRSPSIESWSMGSRSLSPAAAAQSGSRQPERDRRPSSPSDNGMFGCKALIFVCFVQLRS